MPCPRLSRAHFAAVRQGRVAGLTSLSSAWLFIPAPRREMFSTLQYLSQGHPRLYGRCSSPTCPTKGANLTLRLVVGAHSFELRL